MSTDLILSGLQPSPLKRLLKIVNDIANVLQSQTDSDQIRRHTGLDLLLVRQLLVRGPPGVDDQGLRIADVGQVAAQLEVVDDGRHLLDGARNTEGQDTAEAVLEHLLGELVVRVRLETRVQHPVHERVLLEVPREGEGVARGALAAQREGLQTLEEEPRVEGRHAGAQVTHGVHPQLRSQRLVPVGIPELHPVVSLRGLGELGELSAGGPVEVASVDDDASHAGAVASDPLRAGVRDDVRTQGDGPAEVSTHAEGVVDN